MSFLQFLSFFFMLTKNAEKLSDFLLRLFQLMKLFMFFSFPGSLLAPFDNNVNDPFNRTTIFHGEKKFFVFIVFFFFQRPQVVDIAVPPAKASNDQMKETTQCSPLAPIVLWLMPLPGGLPAIQCPGSQRAQKGGQQPGPHTNVPTSTSYLICPIRLAYVGYILAAAYSRIRLYNCCCHFEFHNNTTRTTSTLLYQRFQILIFLLRLPLVSSYLTKYSLWFCRAVVSIFSKWKCKHSLLWNALRLQDAKPAVYLF